MPASDTRNFYPRPPRGGRRGQGLAAAHLKKISIHALREEGDRSRTFTQLPQAEFLSTPSARRATGRRPSGRSPEPISIHALREEGDSIGSLFSASLPIFLSTPSARRATHRLRPFNALRLLFLSTPSARRATYDTAFSSPPFSNFYPRPPRGGRPRAGCIRS